MLKTSPCHFVLKAVFIAELKAQRQLLCWINRKLPGLLNAVLLVIFMSSPSAQALLYVKALLPFYVECQFLLPYLVPITLLPGWIHPVQGSAPAPRLRTWCASRAAGPGHSPAAGSSLGSTRSLVNTDVLFLFASETTNSPKPWKLW